MPRRHKGQSIRSRHGYHENLSAGALVLRSCRPWTHGEMMILAPGMGRDEPLMLVGTLDKNWSRPPSFSSSHFESLPFTSCTGSCMYHPLRGGPAFAAGRTLLDMLEDSGWDGLKR